MLIIPSNILIHASHTTISLSVRIWRTISGQYVGTGSDTTESCIGIDTESDIKLEYIFKNTIQILFQNPMSQHKIPVLTHPDAIPLHYGQ